MEPFIAATNKRKASVALPENFNKVHDSSLFLEARPLMCLGGLDEAFLELEQDAVFYEFPKSRY